MQKLPPKYVGKARGNPIERTAFIDLQRLYIQLPNELSRINVLVRACYNNFV